MKSLNEDLQQHMFGTPEHVQANQSSLNTIADHLVNLETLMHACHDASLISQLVGDSYSGRQSRSYA